MMVITLPLDLLEIIENLNEPLSSIFNQLPKACSTPELNINVDEKKKFKIVEDFVQQIRISGWL